MKMTFSEFKRQLIRVFSGQSDVEGMAIVGSYARGAQQPDSDIDAAIFCHNPAKYLNDQSWLNRFGEVTEVRRERWGPVQTVRAFFSNALEVEFNFSTLAWAEIPVDPGTYRVVSDGFEILYDPTGDLVRLKEAVSNRSESGA